MILTERLYFTEDRKLIVREGDLRAAFLLGGPGAIVPDRLSALVVQSEALAVVQPEADRNNAPQILTRDPEIESRDPVIEGHPKRRGRPPKNHS